MIDLNSLLQSNPKLHVDGYGNPHSWQLSDDVLRFIDAHVDGHSRTLEVGAGVSTVLFALKGSDHLCIVPDEMEVARIKSFCLESDISIDKLQFEIGCSEQCLPNLTISDLDFVLIDGAHGFPVPFLDWYYTSDRLRVGGYLVIDDTHIWTGHTLRMFLSAEPEWTIAADFAPRSVAFKKVLPGRCSKNESHQPYIVRQTIDLMFGLYPKYVEWIRPYVPKELYEAKEREVAAAVVHAAAGTNADLS